MEVVDAIQTWRSTRSYRAEPVNRSDISDLLWLAVQVSTPPENETPWAFCVLEGADRIETLGRRALDFARDHRPPGEWRWVDRPGFRVFLGAPAVILICAVAGNIDAHLDCCRAGQNLSLAAHSRGFGVCWLGSPFPWLRSPGVAEEIGVPSGFEPSVALALGHPAERLEPKSRPRPAIVWS